MLFEGTTAIGLLALAIVPMAALALLYHKLSSAIDRLSKQLPKVSDNLFTQLEALAALRQDLNLAHALPSTRGWAASPDVLRMLMHRALEQCPDCIVECSSGVSTLVLARCVQLNGRGHIYSLEHDAKYAQKTRQLLQKHGLAEHATVIDAPLQRYELNNWQGDWYSLAGLPTDLRINMLVIDGPPWFVAHAARYPAVPLLIDRLGSGAEIYLDDADRDEEQLAVARWLSECAQLKKLDVPVCEKGCAGLIVAAP